MNIKLYTSECIFPLPGQSFPAVALFFSTFS